MSIMLRVAVLAIFLKFAFAQHLQLVTNYSGSAFFDLWNYKVGNDVTNFWGDPANEGTVNFTDQAFAQQQQLLYVNSVGNVMVRVDNFTSGAGNSTFARNSLQLLSKDPITSGHLLIMDAIHMPFGCAVWPAFWLTGGPDWPKFGEIDIVENVNLATTNAYALHTTDGCMASADVAITGNLVNLDCFNETKSDTGCKVVDSELSYGSGFANNGGGAFAFLWNDDGMKIWFFPRPTVPADLSTANPNPNGWGTPTAFFPSTTCDFSQFFGPQTMILEIDVCGNFAVDDWSTCATVAPTCPDVVGTPSTFDDAYFEIKYIALFANSTTAISSTTSGPTTTGGPNVSPSADSTVIVTSSVFPTNTPASSKSGGHKLNTLTFLTTAAGVVAFILAMLL